MQTERARVMAAQRTAARRRQKERDRELDARNEAEIAKILARLVRRSRGTATAADLRFGAELMHARGTYRGDPLAARSTPELYRGWRQDTARRHAYLLDGLGDGLPLAAEGGHPLRCADRVTSDLSSKNYNAWRVTLPWNL